MRFQLISFYSVLSYNDPTKMYSVCFDDEENEIICECPSYISNKECIHVKKVEGWYGIAKNDTIEEKIQKIPEIFEIHEIKRKLQI